MPDQSETDAIIERHRQRIEEFTRLSIIHIFRNQPAWSEGGLRIALMERRLSMNDFVRHHHKLGIQHTRIDDPVQGWWMWFVPNNWNPEESK